MRSNTEAQAMTPENSAIDLQTQLESLLHAVWEQERQWRVEDRIDVSIRLSLATDRRSQTADVGDPATAELGR